MKKILLFAGFGLAGFGLYRYFRYQINLALNYDYNLKEFKIEKVDGETVYVSAVFIINNKSNFKIEIKNYDLQLFFKDIPFANTTSDQSVIIQPNTSFEVTGKGSIDLGKAKIAVLPFLKDVLDRKPIDINVSGNIAIVFLGIPTSLHFDKEKFNYSVDLLKDYNLADNWESFKQKNPKLMKILGLNS